MRRINPDPREQYWRDDSPIVSLIIIYQEPGSDLTMKMTDGRPNGESSLSISNFKSFPKLTASTQSLSWLHLVPRYFLLVMKCIRLRSCSASLLFRWSLQKWFSIGRFSNVAATMGDQDQGLTLYQIIQVTVTGAQDHSKLIYNGWCNSPGSFQ
jgi:hypothetical protein